MFNHNIHKWLPSIKPVSEFDLFLPSANSPHTKEPFMQIQHEAKGRDKKLPKTLWMTTFSLTDIICFSLVKLYYPLSKEPLLYTDGIRGRLGKNEKWEARGIFLPLVPLEYKSHIVHIEFWEAKTLSLSHKCPHTSKEIQVSRINLQLR